MDTSEYVLQNSNLKKTNDITTLRDINLMVRAIETQCIIDKENIKNAVPLYVVGVVWIFYALGMYYSRRKGDLYYISHEYI
jgi:hypothetical protein